MSSLLVLGMAAAPGRPAYGQEAGGSKTVTGVLTLRSGDPFPRSGQEHQYVYSVIDDRGQEHRLDLADEVRRAAGGARNLDKKRVKVRGAVKRAAAPAASASATPEVLEASSVEVTADASPAPEALAGPQKFATILCRFADSTGLPPKDAAYVNGLVGDAYPGISHFWRENSFNQINNLGSVVKGWYTLPRVRSAYVPTSPPNFDLLAADCTAAADAEVNYNDYTGVNLLFDQNLDCCAWGGSTWMTLDGTPKVWPMTWMPPWGYGNQSVLGHEMGHAYGLPHSSGDYGAVYDSWWDVMSDGYGAPDPTYGLVGTHTIAYHKDKLGWIPPARKYVAAPNTCATIAIDHLSQVPTTSGTYLMAQIPTTANRFYTVEARKNNGYDAGRIPAEAIVIHDVLTTRTEPAHVVDATLNGNPNDAGAMWLPGETFTDAANGVSIQVLAATANGWTVRVSNGSCVQPPGAPTNVVATGGNSSAVVSWTPPASSGGSPITGYVVTPFVGANAGVPRTVPVSGTIIDLVTGLITNLLTGLTNGTPVTFQVAAINAAGTGPQSAASNTVVPTASDDRYHALTPARVLDTRNGTGGFSAPVGPGATIAASITGVGGVPAAGVSAVVVNVTATQPTTGGYLTVFPTATPLPTASNLNFTAGQTVPNLVVAKVGPDGKVAIYNKSGNTHVIFDVVGWFPS